MKRKKILMKFIACILTFAMVAGIIPVPDMRGGEKKLGVVEVKASTNSHTKEDAVNWAISQIGKSLDYDKIYGEQCVDLIKYYYDYLGNASYAKGYANEYQWNELPGGWERVYENYAIGDVAVWKPNYGYTGENGHVGIIVGGDYDYVYVVNQNYAGKNYCTEEHVPWDYIACAIRPDFVSKVSTTGIVLNKNSISLSSEGATSQLTATVSPSNATDKSVIWSSGNTGVATVDGDGKVTAVFPGTTTITAKNSGGQTATCTVTVNYNDGWTYSTSLPSNVTTANGYEIQYKNTVATTTTVWVPGEVEAFPKPQATSDYYRYRGYYYYHWCSTGINVNFYQNSTYVHYDAIDPSLVYVVGEYADTEDASIIYYKLNWNDGTLAYCNSNSTCDGSNGTHGNRSYYWYRGYEYQKYSTKTETTYTTSSWVTTKDANATTVQYRYKVIPPTGVSLNATSKTFTAKNATYQLTATVTPSNAKDKTVTWKSSNTSVATVDTTGKVTAVGNGTATITCTTNTGGKTATCDVTVAIEPTGVSLNATSKEFIAKGATYQLVATVTPSDAKDKTVTWKSSNTAVATVDSTGKVTAVGNGTATITCTTNTGGKTATCNITVAIEPIEVSLNATSKTFTSKGATYQLVATVKPSDAADTSVSWKSSNTSVATVDTTGKVTAVGNGSATITCTTNTGGKTATCNITVAIEPTGVSLNATSKTFTSKGATYQLTATVTPSDAADTSVSWKSSNTSVATVDATGKVTAVGNGTATITCTTNTGGKTATCNITVAIEPIEVSLNATSKEFIAKGATYQLVATVKPSDAADTSVSWKSSNTSVATVDATGKVTAVGNGTATITCTTNTGGKTATCNVTVAIEPTGVTLDLSTVTIDKKGNSVQLTATVAPSDAADKTVTWKSSNTSVAIVDSTGKVTAVDNGTAIITVKTNTGSKEATCTVTVKIRADRNGLVLGDDGKYYYYVDDVVSTETTGIIYNAGSYWYIENGVLNTDYIGIAEYNGYKWYVVHGKVQNQITGLITVDGATWYVVDGRVNVNYTGLYDDGTNKWFVYNGSVNKNYTGIKTYNGEFLSLWGGKFLPDFTGFQTHNGAIWYVVNGKVAITFKGFANVNDADWYIVNGKYVNDYNGIVSDGTTDWCVKNGRIAHEYTGLFNDGKDTWYVWAGKVNKNYTGLKSDGKGSFYGLINGKFDSSYTGVMFHIDTYWYIRNGMVDTDYSGVIDYNNTKRFVVNGKMDVDFTGLRNDGSKFWYLSDGVVMSDYNGLVNNSGYWWYIKDGAVATDYVGTVENSAGIWYVAGGKIDTSFTGLGRDNNGNFIAIRNGKYDKTYTGLLNNQGTFWYIKNGMLDTSYTGIVTNTGGSWLVMTGKLAGTYTGKYIMNNITYTVVNGKIVN